MKLDSRTVSCYFIGYSEWYKRHKFYDPTTKLSFKFENARFFDDVEFVGGDIVKDFVFEKEYVDILIGVINKDLGLIPDFIQDTIDQDNIGEPSVQEVVLEEQTLSPQKPMLLRRSTRESRSTVPYDCIVFLWEHEVDVGVIENDLINFCHAMKSSNF